MKRTLLTGFGPFGSVVDNPSQRLVEHFADNGAEGHILTTHVFPVSYARVAPQLTALLGDAGDIHFDNVLMMGVNGGGTVWRIERQGKNADSTGSMDMDGVTADGGAIITGMPSRLECTLPIERVVSALSAADIPAVNSHSAGGYLCNHLLFRVLARLQTADREVIAGFVHIPADPATFGPQRSGTASIPYPPFDMHIRAIETILAELV